MRSITTKHPVSVPLTEEESGGFNIKLERCGALYVRPHTFSGIQLDRNWLPKMTEFGDAITLTAIGVFAVTGVLAGLREDADIFSLMVFGVVTALGAAMIRDMMLNIPCFWVSD